MNVMPSVTIPITEVLDTDAGESCPTISRDFIHSILPEAIGHCLTGTLDCYEITFEESEIDIIKDYLRDSSIGRMVRFPKEENYREGYTPAELVDHLDGREDNCPVMVDMFGIVRRYYLRLLRRCGDVLSISRCTSSDASTVTESVAREVVVERDSPPELQPVEDKPDPFQIDLSKIGWTPRSNDPPDHSPTPTDRNPDHSPTPTDRNLQTPVQVPETPMPVIPETEGNTELEDVDAESAPPTYVFRGHPIDMSSRSVFPTPASRKGTATNRDSTTGPRAASATTMQSPPVISNVAAPASRYGPQVFCQPCGNVPRAPDPSVSRSSTPPRPTVSGPVPPPNPMSYGNRGAFGPPVPPATPSVGPGGYPYGVTWQYFTVDPRDFDQVIDPMTESIGPWLAARPDFGMTVNHAIKFISPFVHKGSFLKSFTKPFDHKMIKEFKIGFPSIGASTERSSSFEYYNRVVTHCQAFSLFVPPPITLRPGNILGTWFKHLPSYCRHDCLTHAPQLLTSCFRYKGSGLLQHPWLKGVVQTTDDGYSILYQLAVLAGHPLLQSNPYERSEPCQTSDLSVVMYIQAWIEFLNFQALGGRVYNERYYLMRFLNGLHASVRTLLTHAVQCCCKRVLLQKECYG